MQKLKVYIACPPCCLLTRCKHVRVRSSAASLLPTVSKQQGGQTIYAFL